MGAYDNCMKPSDALRANRDALQALAARYCLRNLRVFGSVATGADTEGSDVDLLVDVPDGITLFDLGGFQVRAAKLLGVPVDVVSCGDLPIGARSRVLRQAVSV
jgi:predicted nucleotidyltransferase